MCLDFDYAAAHEHDMNVEANRIADAAERELNAKQHVSCDGTQVAFITHEKGAVTTTHRAPIVDASGTSVFFMLPVASACLGKDAEFLREAAPLPCVASILDRIFHSGKYTQRPQRVQTARYRSLSSGDADDGGGALAAPRLSLPPAAVRGNRDGSFTFVLYTGGVALSDADRDQAIAAGKFADVPSYLSALGKAVLENFCTGLAGAGIPLGNVFELDDGGVEPHPVATLQFLDALLPFVAPATDMLVCVPPFEDGSPRPSAAFNFVFHYPAPVAQRPLLGLVHNDAALGAPLAKVEEDFAIFSNTALPLSVASDAPTGVATPIVLHEPSAFLPAPLELVLLHPSDTDATHPEWTEVTDLWLRGCAALQERAQAMLWAEYKKVLVDELGLPPFDASALFLTNLVGMQMPSMAKSVVCGADAEACAAKKVLERMAAGKRKAA
jgi:hypothetical protein